MVQEFGNGSAFLATGGHVPDGDAVGCDFILADYGYVGDGEGVGLAQLSLEAATSRAEDCACAVLAHADGYIQGCVAGFIAYAYDEIPGRGVFVNWDFLALEVESEALHSSGEADAGGRSSPDLFDEAVVATAADEGALAAFLEGLNLEDGAGVVVEAADEAVVHLVGDFHEREVSL